MPIHHAIRSEPTKRRSVKPNDNSDDQSDQYCFISYLDEPNSYSTILATKVIVTNDGAKVRDRKTWHSVTVLKKGKKKQTNY